MRKFLLILLAIIAALVGFRFALKSDWALEQVRTRTEALVPGLVLSRVDGDLLTGLTLFGVSYSDSTVTARFDTLRVTYSAWSLVRRHVDIRTLDVAGADVAYRTPREPTTDSTRIDLPELLITVGDLSIRNGTFFIDGTSLVKDLRMNGSASLEGGIPSLKVGHLSFIPLGLPFPNPSVDIQATATPDRIDLTRLVLATGRSLVESRGVVSLNDETVQAELWTNPLAWRDLTALSSDSPFRQDLSLGLELRGSFRHLSIMLTAEGKGLSGAKLDITAHLTDQPHLSKVSFRSGALNLNTLLQARDLPRIGSVHAEMVGIIPFHAPDSADVRSSLSMRRIHLHDQSIRSVEVRARIRSRKMSGSGTLTPDLVPLRFDFNTDGLDAESPYRLRVETNRFDLRAIAGLENLPSSLNATLVAEGRGTDLVATLTMTASTLNRAPIQELVANLHLRNRILTLSDTRIRSSIVEGEFTAQQNLDDPTDLSNRLDANVRILDLQPLAGLVGLERLAATGALQARLNRQPGGFLRLETVLRIDSARVDDFRSGYLSGDVFIDLTDRPDVDLRLRISDIGNPEPLVAHADLRAMTRLHPDSITSRYRLDVELARSVHIHHEGNLTTTGDRTAIRGDRLDLTIQNERYRLGRPFDAMVSKGEWLIDTLLLRGGSGVEAWITADERGGVIRAKGSVIRANLGHFSEVIGSNLAISGLVDLGFTAEIGPGEPEFETRLLMRDASYSGLSIDSIRAFATLNEGRILSYGQAYRSGSEWIDFNATLPFRFDHPAEMDDAFYKEPVKGAVRVRPTSLDEMRPLFQALGMEPITGTLRMDAKLGGTAGKPEFDGRVDLIRSAIAAVPIDSLGFEWGYDATSMRFRIDSKMRSLNQTALELSGEIPFGIDMRTFEPVAATSDDPLNLTLISRGFDLATINVFVDPMAVRRIGGRLNGQLRIGGTLREYVPTGDFRLTGGTLFLPGNNITIRDIAMETVITPGRIELVSLRGQSNGIANVRGAVRLDGLVPRDMDFRITGQNLRISDTRNLQMFVTMDTRIQGPIDALKATGDIRLERGSIYLEEFGDAAVEEVNLADEQLTILNSLDIYRSMAVEMRILTERNVWVRNRSSPELNLELQGELDLLKTAGGDLQVFGSMGTRQGYLTQLGKRFELDKGDLRFIGDPTDPELAIRTRYDLRQPHDIRIWYEIGGTLDKPVFTYESDPEMELQDIISYTLFSRPFQALMSWEQSLTGSGNVSSLAVDILADRVGELAANRLGLDVVEIDNTRSSGNSGMTIKAGKYVNDRLFIAILQEFGATTDSQVIMEYALRQNLNVVLTGSDRRKSGIDIQWKYDY